jgi:hypothetical protein
MRLHNASGVRMAEATWNALGFEVVEHVRRRPTHRPAALSAGAQDDARAR